jgi:hypothetical protein
LLVIRECFLWMSKGIGARTLPRNHVPLPR